MDIFIANIPALVCFGLATWLWTVDVQTGPGWLVFAGILLIHTVGKVSS